MKRPLVLLGVLLSTVQARAEDFLVGERPTPIVEGGPLPAALPSPAPAAAQEDVVEDAYYDGYYDGYAAAMAAERYDDGYDPRAYEQFEDELAPYGSWIDVETYGHVWMPSTTVVGYDFTPYATGGYFSYSDY